MSEQDSVAVDQARIRVARKATTLIQRLLAEREYPHNVENVASAFDKVVKKQEDVDRDLQAILEGRVSVETPSGVIGVESAVPAELSNDLPPVPWLRKPSPQIPAMTDCDTQVRLMFAHLKRELPKIKVEERWDWKALPTPPAWGTNPFSTVVLEASLGTPQETAAMAWKCAGVSLTPFNWSPWQRSELLLDDAHLKLLDDIEFEPWTLRWRSVNLAAHWGSKDGTKPQDVRTVRSPGAGILWFAALNPRWMMSMDGSTVPWLWIPGYEVKLKGTKKWSHVPVLTRDAGTRQVILYAYEAGLCFRLYAVPAPEE